MLRLRDIMTRKVLTVSPELPLREASDILARYRITGIPVVAGRKVVGVLTTGDLLNFVGSITPDASMETAVVGGSDPFRADGDDGEEGTTYFVDLWPEDESDLTERFERQAGWHRDLFGDHIVSDAMSQARSVLGPEAPVTAAAELMRRNGEQRVLVVQKGRLLGIVSASDIVRAVAEGRLTATRYVFGTRE